ncbi:winged helix-turn-helix transcriptional regulator [Marinimicrobium alkaliphilum]|uniref:winged helix-turn-helix transcriptional regulator n=1 Tax=Marinimicrobium alkaliphilum TaxID=2202654 RepID=UPI000DB92974|nr:winged helix-turn-helix transcriptional regulator [Marinimicrobium alkaliphilum]
MKGYGQFCPLALASEIVGERWTPLILRELILGARRFNHIHHGVPRISPALLSKRLTTLQRAGIVERQTIDTRVEYCLTEAGTELIPIIEQLAHWGKRWLPATLSQDRADPDLIVWDMHRRMALNKLPLTRTVIEFLFVDQPAFKQRRWLVGDRQGVDLCITNPGFDVDLVATTDSRTLTWIWFGDLPLAQAIREDKLRLQGAQHLCQAFPGWLQLSPVAGTPRQRPITLPT